MSAGPTIEELRLRVIYDSRGQPAVEVEMRTSANVWGRAASPSGASTGSHEVRAYPDGGPRVAVARVLEKVRPKVLGFPLDRQAEFDRTLRELDGTPDLSYLGGNTCTALSIALAQTSANAAGVPLFRAIPGAVGNGGPPPALVGNVMNGGAHAIGGPDFQEFIAFVEAPTVAAQIEAAVAVHKTVGAKIRAKFPGIALGRGDEGGWVAPLDNVAGLDILTSACAEVRDARAADKVSVRPGLDLAASEFFKEGRYRLKDRTLDGDGMLDFVAHLVTTHELAYVEDPFDEDDMAHFAGLAARVDARKTLVVGDDLYTTNPARVEKGIAAHASNAVLLKVNQIGTLTDTLTCVGLARRAGWSTITSHRSGETTDAWLSHLALAFGSRGIKCGVLGGERVAKLNELVRLDEARAR